MLLLVMPTSLHVSLQIRVVKYVTRFCWEGVCSYVGPHINSVCSGLADTTACGTWHLYVTDPQSQYNDRHQSKPPLPM